ncbi:MAG: YaiO family outer membrane beta-barrel protein, partial [Candidatus Neomarinimicrobiota bacterium]
PDQADGYLARAKVYHAARRFPQARRDLRRAAGRDGDMEQIDGLRRELNREPASRPWEPRLILDLQTFSGNRKDWTTLNLEVKRELPEGSVSGQLLQVGRFKLVDHALALDGYLNLWRRAYGNAKLQWTNQPQVLPGLDATVELFQGFGRGWEASGSLRRMVFPGKIVMIAGGSLGYYIGDWYGRSRVLFVPDDDGYGVNGAVALRRYFGTVDTFGEVSVSGGREVEYDATETTIHSNSSFALRGQSFLNRRLGITFSLGLGRTANFTQRGFNLGLITRW